MNGITKITASCLLVLGMNLGTPVLAQGTGASQQVNVSAYGSDATTRVTTGSRSVQGMLELQRSQQLASPHRQHVAGDVQARIYQRYLESFSHPIPERYIDPRFTSQ